MRLGHRSVGKPHSLGNRAVLVNVLGRRMTGPAVTNGLHGSMAHNTPHGVPENQMIYNKSNLAEIQYVPVGLGKRPQVKKSYLEKR